MKPPRLRSLGRVVGLAVYLVDGERIRDEIDIDFTMGGNEGVYPNYVPRNEIWLDDAMHPLDMCATALHEIVERDLMLNFGMDYDHAHDIASANERPFRAELLKKRPRAFDGRRVAAAYRAYERGAKKTRNQLDREITAMIGRR
jgi:hypothetical protein